MSELYQATWDYFATLPTVQAWPELAQLLQRALANKPPHWRLAARACLAAGGTWPQAIPAVAALGAHFLSIVLTDDLLDADPKGQHHTLGIGPVANMTSALTALGHAAIDRAPLPTSVQASIHHALHDMMLQTSLGQYLDSQNPADEEAYWRVTRAKSSPFFATSLYVGALSGGCAEATAAHLREIGALYGEMVQINDDLGDALATPADPDWQQGRFPLPILFATLVPHPARERFLYLRGRVDEAWALYEAQEILIRCGAISYGIDQLVQRAQRVQEMLNQHALAQPGEIEALLAGVLEPVHALLSQVNGVK